MTVGVGTTVAAGAGPSGSTWTPYQAPLPSSPAPRTGFDAATTLGPISCPTPGFCVATGGYRAAGGSLTAESPLVDTFSGGTWTASPVPLPSNAAPAATQDAYLGDVTCSEPTSCAAVGYYEDATVTKLGLIDSLSGQTWTVDEAPQPANAGTGSADDEIVQQVACPAAGSCSAVGWYEDTTGGSAGMEATLSNGSWSATELPLPSGAATGGLATASFSSMSCPSPGSCIAVGTYEGATLHFYGLIETLANGVWSATPAPEPSGAGTGVDQRADLNGVACPAGTSCVAVGAYWGPTGHFFGLIDTLSGGTWTALDAPAPLDAGTGTDQHLGLNTVSCSVPGACVAGGQYDSSTGDSAGALETLSGGVWSGIAAPVPPGAAVTKKHRYGSMTGSGCSSAGRCVVVGGYNLTTGHEVPLVDTWSGSTWTAAEAPVPPVSTPGTSLLYGATCTGTSCAATGSYAGGDVGGPGLLETTDMAPSGYFEAASDGGIFAFTLPFHGSEGGKPLNAPIVAAVADPLTGGYYEVASDGGLFAFTAPFHGSMGGKPLNAPIEGMAFDTLTGGYWLVASDGGLFAFTAPFLGSMGGKPLNEPIVGMAFDPETGGYWEVASDGGLFSFGAPFLGSMGGRPLVAPIVGMTYDTLTNGYYEVASDGGLFAFTAPFHGSMGGKPLNEPVVGMAFDWGTGGYWEVASDGGLFAFTAPFLGSMGGKPLDAPIVTMVVG